jgi:ribosomal protein L28
MTKSEGKSLKRMFNLGLKSKKFINYLTRNRAKLELKINAQVLKKLSVLKRCQEITLL